VTIAAAAFFLAHHQHVPAASVVQAGQFVARDVDIHALSLAHVLGIGQFGFQQAAQQLAHQHHHIFVFADALRLWLGIDGAQGSEQGAVGTPQRYTYIGAHGDLFGNRGFGIGRFARHVGRDVWALAFNHAGAQGFRPTVDLARLDAVTMVVGEQHDPVFPVGTGNHP